MILGLSHADTLLKASRPAGGAQPKVDDQELQYSS